MPLHDEQLLRVREVFAAVYGLDPPERAARLAYEGDPQVRAEVEALLTNDAPARDLLPSMATTAGTSSSNGGAGLEILPGYERALGKDYIETLGVAMNLASAIRLQGRFDEASIEWESLEARLRAAVGDDHPNVALAGCNLGELALELGDPDEAIARYEPALDRLEAALGDSPPARITAQDAVARATQSFGDGDPRTARVRRRALAFDRP